MSTLFEAGSEIKCLRLVYRPKENCHVKRLPSAESLARCYSGMKRIFRISDMLPHDFLYKPLSLDLSEIHSDEEYHALKRIKKAKYVHRELLPYVEKPQALLQAILHGNIEVRDEKIISRWTSCDLMQKEPESKQYRTIVFALKAEMQFDVYLSADFGDRDGTKLSEYITADGNGFTLIEAEPYAMPQSGKAVVLQADWRIDRRRPFCPVPDDVFRLRYDPDTGEQYRKAGSVLTLDKKQTDTLEIQPFFILKGENS